MASQTYELARGNPEAQMAGGVKLVFPAFDDLPEKTVFYGTARFEADGEDYVRALADMPYVRAQRGLSQDGASFFINDPRSEIYVELKKYEDVLEDAEVVVKEFLKTKLDIFESEIIHNGFLTDMGWSDASSGINCSSISDMSRAGFLTGGRILTQRYCAAVFNKNGLKDPQFDPCRWTLEQGGNPVFCTHKYLGVDGCVDHNNPHRYYAVEALSTAEIQTYSGSVGGFPYGGGYNPACFTPQTLVWMGDGSYQPIYQIKKGDVVMSFKPDGTLVKGKVARTMKHLVDNHLSIDFGKGRILEPKAEHLFLIAPDSFKAIGALDSGDTVRSQNEKGWFDFAIRNTWLTEKRTRVHNFEVEEFHVYFVVSGGVKIAVSNYKAAPQVNEF